MNKTVQLALKFILSLLVIAGVVSCAHQSKYNEYTDFPVVSILQFRNNTFQPELEENLTRFIIEEFLSDGRIDLVNTNDSKLIISGQINRYSRSILSLGNNDDVNLYQLYISVDLEILNTLNKETVAIIPNINTTTTFVPIRSSIEFETETDAQNRLMRDLAEEILYQVLDKKPNLMNRYNSWNQTSS